MTKERLELCKIIIKYKNLDTILEKSKMPDYLALQDAFNPNTLRFSNSSFNSSTIVSLTPPFLEEYEKQRNDIFYRRVPLTISIIAIIIAFLSLLLSFYSLYYC